MIKVKREIINHMSKGKSRKYKRLLEKLFKIMQKNGVDYASFYFWSSDYFLNENEYGHGTLTIGDREENTLFNYLVMGD